MKIRKPRKTLSFNLEELQKLYHSLTYAGLKDSYLFDKIDAALDQVIEKKLILKKNNKKKGVQ